MNKWFSCLKAITLWVLLLMPLTAWCQRGYVFSENIKPLIKTQWGQGFPYNILCPKSEKDGQTVYQLAGCGALAMAQMVNYHRYPAMSPDGVYAYDWEQMYWTYLPGISKERVVGVAKLISDCGVSSFTQYSEVSSSTNLSTMMGAMKRLFRYSDEMSIYQRADFATPERDSLFRLLIFTELKAGRPVFYRGYNETKKEGHLFLIDGCKGSKVHVNMGWAGEGDGYYDLDDLKGYSAKQWMLIDVADSTYHPDYTDIRLDEAGTLGAVLTPTQQLQTRHLKLAGHMNGDDFAVLRKMLKTGLLRTIDMEDVELKALPDSAFFECTYLSHLKAPKTLKHTGHVTFYRCRNLNRVVFAEGLESVGGQAFSGCVNLLEVKLPSTVTRIYGNAFTSCEALLNVVLPDRVEYLGNYAFSWCKHLNSLHLPKGMKSMGKEITKECPRLKRLTLDSGNPYYRVVDGEIQKIQ